MKKVVLLCESCGKIFVRPLKEHRRSLKLNRKEYCSLKCAGNINVQHLIKRKNKFNIAKWNKENGYPSSPKDEYSKWRYFLRKVKERSKKKNWETNLTLEYLKDLWNIQNGLCSLTGIKMYLPNSTATHQNETTTPIWASLDRIDSSKPYIQGNVQFVCLSINYAKNAFTTEEVREFISQIRS